MSDNTAIILGATGGIGSALTRRLAKNGWELLIAARSEDALKTLAEETGASYQVTDATKSREVTELFATGKVRFETLGAAVNCVGSILLKPAHMISDEEWERTIALNMNTAFYTVREAVKVMKRQPNGGAIALCSTAASLIGLPNHEAISAAKAGVTGLVKATAASYASQKIRVNAVAPGLVDTPMAKQITGNENAMKVSLAMHPMGRIGQPEDIASALAWMIDPEQSWMTGQTIAVDGGLATIKQR